MNKGNRATLVMSKMLLSAKEIEEQEYSAIVSSYDVKRGYIIFQLDTGELTELSLDVIYVCRIQTDNGYEECTGRIEERYCGSSGKMFKLGIQNGFYKINIK